MAGTENMEVHTKTPFSAKKEGGKCVGNKHFRLPQGTRVSQHSLELLTAVFNSASWPLGRCHAVLGHNSHNIMGI